MLTCSSWYWNQVQQLRPETMAVGYVFCKLMTLQSQRCLSVIYWWPYRFDLHAMMSISGSGWCCTAPPLILCSSSLCSVASSLALSFVLNHLFFNDFMEHWQLMHTVFNSMASTCQAPFLATVLYLTQLEMETWIKCYKIKIEKLI